MKVETLNKTTSKKTQLSSALSGLKPGQCLRLTTAREGRAVACTAHGLGKKLGVKFRTANDGDDVLVWKV